MGKDNLVAAKTEETVDVGGDMELFQIRNSGFVKPCRN